MVRKLLCSGAYQEIKFPVRSNPPVCPLLNAIRNLPANDIPTPHGTTGLCRATSEN